MDVTWWMIGLGILWGLFVLPTFVMAIMSIPGNPGRNDPMLMLPPLFLFGAFVLAGACVCGILFGVGWLSPHGLWRGETVLLAPLAIPVLMVLAFVPFALALLFAAAVVALLIFLSQYSVFFLVLLGILAAVVVFGVAVSIYFSIEARLSARTSTKPTAAATVKRASNPEPAIWMPDPTPVKWAPDPEPVKQAPDTGPCTLIWHAEAVEFGATEGLPLDIDPDHRRSSVSGPNKAGEITFRGGVTRDGAFVQWCESGSRTDADGAAALAVPGLRRDLGVRVFRGGKIFRNITLRGGRASRFEAAPPGRDGNTTIRLLGSGTMDGSRDRERAFSSPRRPGAGKHLRKSEVRAVLQ